MSSFKGKNREGVKEITENSRETTEMGQKMVEEADKINALLESINLQDDEDVRAIHDTSRSYDSSFDSAFEENVESAKEEIEGQGAEIRSTVDGELDNVRSGISNLEQAGATSEIGKDAADSGRSKLESSSKEYEGIMTDAENVVNETQQKVDALKNNLSSIFG